MNPATGTSAEPPTTQSVRHVSTAEPPTFELLFLPLGDDGHGDPLPDAVDWLDRHGAGARCCMPRFADPTWYGNHPTDPNHQYEERLAETIRSVYRKPGGERLPLYLVGMSKSGFGAMSFLRRNPHLADGAIIWDAPLMLKSLQRRSMVDTFGSEEVFERYRLADARFPAELGDKDIVLAGWSLWGMQMKSFHHRLQSQGIAHAFVWGPKRSHRWDSGWLPDCLAALRALRESRPRAVNQKEK